MAPPFKLETLLRIRSIREELALERLRSVQHEVKLAEQNLVDMQGLETQGRESFLGENSHVLGAQLQFLQKCSTVTTEAVSAANRKLTELHRQLREARSTVDRAHKEIRVIERLKERYSEEIRVLETRSEQKRLDEAFQLTSPTQTGQSLPGK